MKGSESQKWSVNFIDGYFEYILSLYKKEESSPKCYMDLLIIISDAIDYLRQHRINTKSALYNRCQIKTVDNF